MIAQTGQGIHLGPDLDGPVRQGVLERDRGVGSEEAHEVQLAGIEAGRLAATLEVEDAQHALAAPQRRQDDGRRIGSGPPDAARLSRAQHLRDDAARVGQPARQEGVGVDTAGQQRGELPLPQLVHVDAQGVHGDDAPEAVGDLGHDGRRVEVREDGLGHAQQLALAVELLVQRLLLGAQAGRDVGVDHGLRRDRGVDAQVAQVVGGELVEAQLGEDDDADGAVLVEHGRHEHRLVEVVLRARHQLAARVAGRHRAGTAPRRAWRPSR